MKKIHSIFIILAIYSTGLFANPNYKNGNGTIISSTNENGIKKTVRKCEMADIEIGDLLDEKHRDIYSDCNKENKIGKLKDNDKISVEQICSIEYPKNDELWYKIKFENLSGWINVNSGDPYSGNNYEVLEEINVNGKKWTVRKMKQIVTVWENLNMRDKPGTAKTKVVYTIRPRDTDPVQTNVEVIAMTEEKETIEGITDFWLKIKYKEYEGWIFGGFTSVERGGPKYYIPEYSVIFDLSWF